MTPFLEVRSDRQVWVDLIGSAQVVLSSTPHKSVALCIVCWLTVCVACRCYGANVVA